MTCVALSQASCYVFERHDEADLVICIRRTVRANAGHGCWRHAKFDVVATSLCSMFVLPYQHEY